MRVYIATAWDNRDEARSLARLLEKRGHEHTCSWWDLDFAAISWPAVQHEEMMGVSNADALIVLLPGKLGTHTELGMALALGKRVLVIGAPVDEHEAGMLCVAYVNALVTRLPPSSADDIDAVLRRVRVADE